MRLAYLYLTGILFFVLFSYLFIDANLFYLSKFYTGIYFDHKIFVSVIYSFFIFFFLAFYFYLLRKKIDKKLIKRYVIFSIPLVFSYPAMLSFDIFNYILTAKLSFLYLENPYVVMPIEILGEPMLSFTHAANKLALYGPFWIIMTSVPYYLGLKSFILTLLLFKFFVAIFYFLTLRIIYLISKSLVSVIFFALNPLVVIETFVSGHNDIVMMFFALASFYFLIKRKILIAILFIFLSILIKYATIFLLPLFIFYLVKSLRNEKISVGKLGIIGFFLMLAIYILSPLREEIYPWYTIWLLTFASLVIRNKMIFYFSVALSFFVMFRYIPFMATGTHFGFSPLIKTAVTLLPFSVLLFFSLKKIKWLRR